MNLDPGCFPTGRLRGALLFLLAAGALAPGSLAAQVVASEKSLLRQTIAGTEIEIEYSRPSIRGREMLFGGQIDWDRSWTPGANANTIFRFSQPVTLAGATVEAGSYGVWMEPREEGPWGVALFSDTTLFHTAHPDLEDGDVVFDVQPATTNDFTETLTLHFPSVVGARGTLEMRWGNVSIPMELQVESGLTFVVSQEEAGPLEGEWVMIPGRDPESDGMPIEFAYNPDSGRIEGVWTQGRSDVDVLLLRKAEGVYQLGMMVGDELGSVIDTWFIEFVFDESGQAESFEVRGQNDDIRYRGRRAGG